jgi:hypothetical protein
MSQTTPVDTVVFLGAGASAFAGFQTFRRFGDLILDKVLRYREGLPDIDIETPRLVSEIHTSLEKMHRPTTHDNYLWLLTDYRNFCAKFDVHSGLQDRFPRIPDDIRAFGSISQTVIDDITKTTFCHYSRQRNTGGAGEEIRQLYERIAVKNDPVHPFLPIFTTNYDLLVEDLYADSNKTVTSIPFSNGIPGQTRKGSKWNQKTYESYGIHLYRLHGCVGWFNDQVQPAQSTEIYFNRPSEINADFLKRLCVMFPGREMERGKNPHGFGFRRFFSTLLSCRRIIFIGFSFRDDDVMHILLAANALREDPVRLVIIDPRIGPEDILKSLEEAARRSIFQARLPKVENIVWNRIPFGQPGIAKVVMTLLDAE